MQENLARARAVVENIQPEIDGGRFPIKRLTGESVVVEADVFGDGHDVVECVRIGRTEYTVPTRRQNREVLLPIVQSKME